MVMLKELSVAEHVQLILKNSSSEILCPDRHADDLLLAVEGLEYARGNLGTVLMDDVTRADVSIRKDNEGSLVKLTRWACTGSTITYLSRQARISVNHPDAKLVRKGRKPDKIARVAMAVPGDLAGGLAEWDSMRVAERVACDAVRHGVEEGAKNHPALRSLVTFGDSGRPLSSISINYFGERPEEDPRFPNILIAVGAGVGESKSASRYVYNQPRPDAVDMTPYVNSAMRVNDEGIHTVSTDERANVYERVVHEQLGMLHALTGVFALAAYELRTGVRIRP